ncbi:MAG TPA: peptide chain release factor N(5)-glutamine methyltransferase [Cyclobacteriaceae bacterium]|nr:peptide chain release factor N(5)-glutamine methyltransferase [Cyclobacteriaceae bacterium]
MNRKLSNSKVVFQSIKSRLTLPDQDEVQAVALAIMEKHFGLSLTQILSEKQIENLDFSETIRRVNGHEPLQYIFGEADFYGRKFKVDPSVLIPRPETELLIREALSHHFPAPRILDVGTGGGCIAITLQLEIPNAKVTALDVSEQALTVAKKNAKALNADVAFIQANFLHDLAMSKFDLIVSNPPYVCESERKGIEKNVLSFEPHEALFVPDDDPLVFYKTIASKSPAILQVNGKIVVEINERFGKEIKELFEKVGFNSVQIVKDLDGKDRIVSAAKI